MDRYSLVESKEEDFLRLLTVNVFLHTNVSFLLYFDYRSHHTEGWWGVLSALLFY